MANVNGPTFAVLLWSRPGLAAEATAYEDKVLPLLEVHGGTLVQRLRSASTDAEQPVEIQTIRFASDAAYAAYMADPRRTDLAEERDRVIARTELISVEFR
ncbi:hypothetical protein OG921_14755 [Aldersonia sp. NBC_00410]|uniref:hypothetical protein n=1 Tax=Aldersonia sp. NBC_00410 TaxID=2975954 RepID=UPI0022529F53|nr:hypothetical protein [Aldersonia sp. NBC_00410]MCX5044428.1 hypothetical protein [Aldersonia sp. NBC_00410]